MTTPLTARLAWQDDAWKGRIYRAAQKRRACVAAILNEEVDFAGGDKTNGFTWRAETQIADEDYQLFDIPSEWDDRPFATSHWRRPKP
jgi:hypothetical protein